jgi:hypothetical protein
MPLFVSVGMAVKNASIAANPPAEAPIPTTGKLTAALPSLRGLTDPAGSSDNDWTLCFMLTPLRKIALVPAFG